MSKRGTKDKEKIDADDKGKIHDEDILYPEEAREERNQRLKKIEPWSRWKDRVQWRATGALIRAIRT